MVEQKEAKAIKSVYNAPSYINPALTLNPGGSMPAFSKAKQGQTINDLPMIMASGHEVTYNEKANTATFTRGNLSFTMPDSILPRGLRVSTNKLLDVLNIEFTKNGGKSPKVTTTLDYYMAACGLKDRKEARRQVSEELETLFTGSIDTIETGAGGYKASFSGVRIIQDYLFTKDGTIEVTYSDKYYDLMKGYSSFFIPMQLLRINSHKNPHSYFLLDKINIQKEMNKNKPNEDIISVKALISICPDLPTYEEVMKGNKNVKDRIIKPFERDMDALKPTLTWKYCHSKGKPLTKKEVADLTYAQFERLMVQITWNDYPKKAKTADKAEKPGKKKDSPN